MFVFYKGYINIVNQLEAHHAPLSLIDLIFCT